MRKFDLSLRSSRSSYFATFRHQLTILSKTDALDEEKWLNMLGTFVKDCVTIDVLTRTPGNNVYVGFMVLSNFTATKCRGLVSLNQVIKEIICLQPLK